MKIRHDSVTYIALYCYSFVLPHYDAHIRSSLVFVLGACTIHEPRCWYCFRVYLRKSMIVPPALFHFFCLQLVCISTKQNSAASASSSPNASNTGRRPSLPGQAPLAVSAGLSLGHHQTISPRSTAMVAGGAMSDARVQMVRSRVRRFVVAVVTHGSRALRQCASRCWYPPSKTAKTEYQRKIIPVC